MASIAKLPRTLKRPKVRPPRPVCLPDGEYNATLKAWCLNQVPGEKRTDYKRLELHWQITYKGGPIIIRQFFNVAETKRGLSAGWSSKLMRNYATLFSYPRKELIDPDNFAGCLIKVATRTVEHGRGSRKLSGKAKYSVVESLVELVAGANPNE